VFVRLRGYTNCSFAYHGIERSYHCNCFDLVDDPVHVESTLFNQTQHSGIFYFKSFMAPTVDLSSCEREIGNTYSYGAHKRA